MLNDKLSVNEANHLTKKLLLKRLILGIFLIREMVGQNNILDLIDKSSQLDDVLTKSGAVSSNLLDVFLCCGYMIHLNQH